MPAGVGGAGSAPSPGWFLRAATASCVASLFTMRAAQQAIVVAGLEVAVDSESDDRGILGIDDGVPAGPLSTSIRVRVTSGGGDAVAVRSAAEWAVAHCPVADALKRAVPVAVEVEVV